MSRNDIPLRPTQDEILTHQKEWEDQVRFVQKTGRAPLRLPGYKGTHSSAPPKPSFFKMQPEVAGSPSSVCDVKKPSPVFLYSYSHNPYSVENTTVYSTVIAPIRGASH